MFLERTNRQKKSVTAFCYGCSALLQKKVSLVHIIMAQETSVSNFEMIRTSLFPHTIMHDLGAFPHPYRVK
jgi:hypothetical protein